jgi:hypothetical protein
VLQYYLTEEDIVLFIHACKDDPIVKLPDLITVAGKNVVSRFGNISDVVVTLMKKVRETSDRQKQATNTSKMSKD